MSYKRILTMQDISCVGQCSMTVAMPILSACGHETCILPTAVLSTHTGGFGKPAVIHLDSILEETVAHWKKNDITFDAVLIGYLGSIAAVEAAEYILDTMLAPGGIAIVDPAMADHGKLYSGLDTQYAAAMKKLCYRADIILPNLTEAAMFAGVTYDENYEIDYVNRILTAMDHPCVVLTGIGADQNTTGAYVAQGMRRTLCCHKKLGGSFHGTGDMFAACFAGALLQGNNIVKSAEIAGNFTKIAIEKTIEAPAHRYGVKFEQALPELMRMLGHV